MATALGWRNPKDPPPNQPPGKPIVSPPPKKTIPPPPRRPSKRAARRPSLLDLPSLMLPAAAFISMVNYSAWYWWWV